MKIRIDLTIQCIAILLALTSCSEVEITSNTYFCGPNGLCPEGQVCQYEKPPEEKDLTFDCTIPKLANTFQCNVETLQELGGLDCGEQIAGDTFGCITDSEKSIAFEITQNCKTSNTSLHAQIRFPIGAAPLYIDIIDENAKVLGTSDSCTPNMDPSGTSLDLRCVRLDAKLLSPGKYQLRISLEKNSNSDCDGECSFNQFQITLSYQ